LFVIETIKSGSTIVDTNINFASIGIADFAITYSTSEYGLMENDGSNLGGYLTNYILTFKNVKFLPKNTWFRLEFPKEYTKFG